MGMDEDTAPTEQAVDTIALMDSLREAREQLFRMERRLVRLEQGEPREFPIQLALLWASLSPEAQAHLEQIIRAGIGLLQEQKHEPS